MNPIRTILYLLLFLLVLAIPHVHAQQETGTTLLPEIDPQDIEIRGDFNVRFPGISRQPILGFSPRAAVFRIDPDRMPFIESDEEIVAAIPISVLEPALKPEQQFIRFADHRRVFARGGYGTFQSPEIKIIAESPLRNGESAALDFKHYSSAGDRNFSSYRDIHGNLQWTRRSGNNRWGVGITGGSQFNYSPELELTEFDKNNMSTSFLEGGGPDPQRRNRYNLGVEARWQQLEHAYRGWQSVASVNRFANTGEFPDLQNRSTEETRYDASLNRFWEGGIAEQVFGFKFGASGGFYDTGLNNSQYWFTNKAGGRYRHLFGVSHRVEAWLRLYQLYDPVNKFDLYLYPDIHYQYYGDGRISALVRVRGFVNDPALEKLDDNNRFMLQYGNDLEHERGLHIRLHSGLQAHRNVKVYMGIDFRQYFNHGYFAREIDQSISVASQSPWYEYRYLEEAFQMEWYNGVTSNISSIRTTATLEWGLNYTMVDEEIISTEEIPHIPRWRGSAHVMSNPLSWLYISTWLDYMGKRKTVNPDILLSGYLQLGAKTDIRLHNHLGIYVKFLNMLNQDYEIWHNYNEPPFQIYGGLTLYW